MVLTLPFVVQKKMTAQVGGSHQLASISVTVAGTLTCAHRHKTKQALKHIHCV